MEKSVTNIDSYFEKLQTFLEELKKKLDLLPSDVTSANDAKDLQNKLEKHQCRWETLKQSLIKVQCDASAGWFVNYC